MLVVHIYKNSYYNGVSQTYFFFKLTKEKGLPPQNNWLTPAVACCLPHPVPNSFFSVFLALNEIQLFFMLEKSFDVAHIRPKKKMLSTLLIGSTFDKSSYV